LTRSLIPLTFQGRSPRACGPYVTRGRAANGPRAALAQCADRWRLRRRKGTRLRARGLRPPIDGVDALAAAGPDALAAGPGPGIG